MAKFESEIDSVRQREDRDRSLLAAGTIDAKQLTDLQHELETLERRQSSLEDSLLEVMERREELQSEPGRRAGEDRRTAEQARRRAEGVRRRARRNRPAAPSIRSRGVTNSLPGWTPIWLRSTNASGPTAARAPGLLQGRRCGACRIEIDRGELARISAAAEDDVLRCPECGAILLRVKGTGA